MAQSFNCPNCGAPLDYDGSDLTVRCPFCSSSVIVPETLRPAAPVAGRSPSPQVVGLDTLIGQADKLREIARLIRAGNKIQAIKVYREAFDVSLSEAKNAVEALEAGMPVVMPGQSKGTGLSLADLQIKVAEAIQSNNKIEAIRLYRANYPSVPLHQAQSAIEKFMATGKLEESTPPPAARERTIDPTDPTAQARADIARLLQENNKIQAIKLYRQVTNAGLKEAKDAVEAFEAGQPLVFTHGIYKSSSSQSSNYQSSNTASRSSTTYTNTKPASQSTKAAGCLGWLLIAGFAIVFSLVLTVAVTYTFPNTLRIAAPFFCPNGYDDAYGIKEGNGLFLHCIVNPDRNISHGLPLTFIPIFFFYFLIGAWIGLAIGFVRLTGGGWSVVFLLPLATLLFPVIFWATDVPAGNSQDGFWILFTTRDGTRFTPPALEQWLSRFSYATETLAFGAEGTDPGYFNDARSIAVDKEGTIYVADYNPGRVQVFDSAGNFITQWSLGDTYISDIAIGSDNQLYVISSGDLGRYNSITGQLLGQITQDTNLNNLAIEPDGTLVAADDQNLIWFSPQGQQLRTSDTFQELTGDDISSNALAIDSAGNIYLAGNSAYKIYIFSPQGKLTTKFGSEGDADDQFDFNPDALALDAQGRLYTHANYSLHTFDAQGNFLTDTGIDTNTFDMAFTPQNDLLVIDYTAHQVVQYHLNR